MGGLGNGDNRTPYAKPEYGDKDVVGAMEGERRRSIAYRGRAESALAVIGAGMALVVGAAIVFNVARAVF
jgi:hypothetical protein